VHSPFPDLVPLIVLGRNAASSGQLRELRLALGLTVCDLARVTGANPSSVSRWERNITRPDVEHACRLGEVVSGMVAAEIATR